MEERNFLNSTRSKIYSTRTSIQHWQLRDLLACPQGENELLHVNGTRLFKFDTSSQLDEQVCQAPFSPTCMTANDGLAVLGGENGQLYVKNLDTGSVVFDASIGSAINNGCHIGRFNGQLRLFVSSNDCSIKVYDLSTMTRLSTIALSAEVNYCASAPDGKTLCAVTDSSVVHVITAKGDGSYAVAKGYHVFKDSGFCCAWDSTGTKMAAGSQDCTAAVFDIRADKILARLKGNQDNAQRGACRALKFSPSRGYDILAFTEHTSYLHLVDARTFDAQQIVTLGSDGCHIAGTCFSPDSRKIFAATEQQIFEFSIELGQRRTFPTGVLC